MNPPKFTEEDYISFLVAGPKIFTCTEAERVQSGQENSPPHDSVGRLLHRLKASAEALRNGALPFAGLKNGVPVLDGSTLDKLYAHHIEPVCRHRSGKHRSVVKGICLLTLLRTDGDAHIPCDYRIYSKAQDGKTENDRFSDLLYKAEIRGFEPSCVLSDSRYAELDNIGNRNCCSS